MADQPQKPKQPKPSAEVGGGESPTARNAIVHTTSSSDGSPGVPASSTTSTSTNGVSPSLVTT